MAALREQSTCCSTEDEFGEARKKKLAPDAEVRKLVIDLF
jgi:hypothetical protein